jgi:phosphoenolpyruvate-protein kinase (PTS system EI component)
MSAARLQKRIQLDTGSVGQHAAVTAREYGILAVITTGDNGKRIPDKNRIMVDGSKGRCRSNMNNCTIPRFRDGYLLTALCI